jgi:phosphoribosylformimino-5-aminoimidazole carboxamide ribotide isomerase
MIIIPAIDLKEGRCVRLKQGIMEESTVYSEDPVDVAKRWEHMGADLIHVVDLDGAMAGKPVNQQCIKEITESVEIRIQVGGGIRDLKTVEEYMNIGVFRIVLGTVAIKNPLLVEDACNSFPGQIAAGIDAKEGMVAINGWTEKTEEKAIDFATELEDLGVSVIIYTDISRDGMLTGPNISATKEMAMSLSIPLIASGGVSSMDDLIALHALEDCGVEGAIVGKALYTGDVDLRKAIKLVER